MKLAVIGTVTAVHSIEGADRIQQAIVSCGDEGVWSGVVAKDMAVGAVVVVFLQDALLPPNERWEFMSKHKWRVRMARFKGVPSECVIVPAIGAELFAVDGADATEPLGVTKYEKTVPGSVGGDARGNFPDFIPKTDEPNFQRVRDLERQMDGSDWVVTLKYDGTSCTVWHDDEGMHVCSRNLELKEFTETGAGNVYWQAARKYRLDEIGHGFAVQFEVYGPGIQGNPMGATEIKIAVFTAYDIQRQRRAHFGVLAALCDAADLPMATVVAAGSGVVSAENLRFMADSARYENGKQAEGIVVRDINSTWSFKVISLDYKD